MPNQNRPPRPPSRHELADRVADLEARLTEALSLIADLRGDVDGAEADHDALAERVSIVEQASTTVTS